MKVTAIIQMKKCVSDDVQLQKHVNGTELIGTTYVDI